MSYEKQDLLSKILLKDLMLSLFCNFPLYRLDTRPVEQLLSTNLVPKTTNPFMVNTTLMPDYMLHTRANINISTTTEQSNIDSIFLESLPTNPGANNGVCTTLNLAGALNATANYIAENKSINLVIALGAKNPVFISVLTHPSKKTTSQNHKENNLTEISISYAKLTDTDVRRVFSFAIMDTTVKIIEAQHTEKGFDLLIETKTKYIILYHKQHNNAHADRKAIAMVPEDQLANTLQAHNLEESTIDKIPHITLNYQIIPLHTIDKNIMQQLGIEESMQEEFITILYKTSKEIQTTLENHPLALRGIHEEANTVNHLRFSTKQPVNEHELSFSEIKNSNIFLVATLSKKNDQIYLTNYHINYGYQIDDICNDIIVDAQFLEIIDAIKTLQQTGREVALSNSLLKGEKANLAETLYRILSVGENIIEIKSKLTPDEISNTIAVMQETLNHFMQTVKHTPPPYLYNHNVPELLQQLTQTSENQEYWVIKTIKSKLTSVLSII